MGKRGDTRIDLLRRLPAFHGCTDTELARLARLVDERRLAAGTVLTREGTVGHQAFVIVGGFAAVMVRGEPVAVVGPGELVGEVAMLDGGPRTATVVAKTDLDVLVIGPESFGDFAHEPAVSRELARELAGRLRTADAGRTASGHGPEPTTGGTP